jgi:hypothetical protein
MSSFTIKFEEYNLDKWLVLIVAQAPPAGGTNAGRMKTRHTSERVIAGMSGSHPTYVCAIPRDLAQTPPMR